MSTSARGMKLSSFCTTPTCSSGRGVEADAASLASVFWSPRCQGCRGRSLWLSLSLLVALALSFFVVGGVVGPGDRRLRLFQFPSLLQL